MTSQKLGYQKRGRNVYGPNYIEPVTPITDSSSCREQKSVGKEAADHREQTAHERNKVSDTVVEQHVELRDCSVRSVEVQYPPPLPCRVLEKDQKVALAEMVKDKRLGQALAVAKRMQDLALPSKVNTAPQKLGYQKRGRQIYGPDYVPKIPAKSVKEGPIPDLLEQVG